MCISLGFAMLENIYYVYLRGGLGDPYAVALVRSFTAVPAHAIFGAVMGINFSRYRFNKSVNFASTGCYIFIIACTVIGYGAYLNSKKIK